MKTFTKMKMEKEITTILQRASTVCVCKYFINSSVSVPCYEVFFFNFHKVLPAKKQHFCIQILHTYIYATNLFYFSIYIRIWWCTCYCHSIWMVNFWNAVKSTWFISDCEMLLHSIITLSYIHDMLKSLTDWETFFDECKRSNAWIQFNMHIEYLNAALPWEHLLLTYLDSCDVFSHCYTNTNVCSFIGLHCKRQTIQKSRAFKLEAVLILPLMQIQNVHSIQQKYFCRILILHKLYYYKWKKRNLLMLMLFSNVLKINSLNDYKLFQLPFELWFPLKVLLPSQCFFFWYTMNSQMQDIQSITRITRF